MLSCNRDTTSSEAISQDSNTVYSAHRKLVDSPEGANIGEKQRRIRTI